MFITFEGGEGSGKTTVIKTVSEFLTENNIDNIITREPGGTRISEDIRNIILNSKNQRISAETESLLFAAARTQHLKEIILPALEEKKFVLCDRYLDSSLAYQGYARGLGIQEVLEINRFATKHMPDYTIYIDTDPKEGLKRAFSRGETNRLDKEGLIFHKKVREGFLQLSKEYPYRYIVIDGNCSLDQLIFRVVKEIKRVIRLAEFNDLFEGKLVYCSEGWLPKDFLKWAQSVGYKIDDLDYKTDSFKEPFGLYQSETYYLIQPDSMTILCGNNYDFNFSKKIIDFQKIKEEAEMRKRFEKIFKENYKGKRLLSIQLNGFSHAVFYDNGTKDSKIYSNSYSHYTPEWNFSSRAKALFKDIGHNRYQNDPVELLFCAPEDR